MACDTFTGYHLRVNEITCDWTAARCGYNRRSLDHIPACWNQTTADLFSAQIQFDVWWGGWVQPFGVCCFFAVVCISQPSDYKGGFLSNNHLSCFSLCPLCAMLFGFMAISALLACDFSHWFNPLPHSAVQITVLGINASSKYIGYLWGSLKDMSCRFFILMSPSRAKTGWVILSPLFVFLSLFFCLFRPFLSFWGLITG